jgi:hypothetical protein
VLRAGGKGTRGLNRYIKGFTDDGSTISKKAVVLADHQSLLCDPRVIEP